MTTPTLHRRAVLALVLTSLLWSTGGLLIKSVPLSGITIAGTRSAIAALVMWVWLRRLRPTWSAAQLGGIVAYAATVTLFVLATKLTSAANAILLQYTAPIWVALLSAVITRERLRWFDGVTVAAVMCGMVVFFLDQLEGPALTGTIVAVLSGVAFAFVALCVRAQRGVATTETIVLGNILTAFVCLPFAAFGGTDAAAWMSLVALGVVQLGVSYLLYSWALAHVTAIEAILITVMEPLLNPVWVVLGTGEAPSAYAIIGGVVVVGSVVARGIIAVRWETRQARSFAA
jgi:drug/metabolite transporter (DMT)-like permease